MKNSLITLHKGTFELPVIPCLQLGGEVFIRTVVGTEAETDEV